MKEHGISSEEAIRVAVDHLVENPDYYELLEGCMGEEIDKAALEAGKTGRHDLELPPGSKKDCGAQGDRSGGTIKVQTPEDGTMKWRSVRAGMIAAPDGTATSALHPNPGANGEP
jgi:hypothetical protein